MQFANDTYKNDYQDYDKIKIEIPEIGDVDELIFPDEEEYYVSER